MVNLAVDDRRFLVDRVSARSLQTVGDVFLDALPRIEAHLRRCIVEVRDVDELRQLLGDPRQRAHAHVEDERPREPRERVPVDRGLRLGRVLVAGHECDGARRSAVRHRHTGVCGRGDARGDAGDDLEGDTGHRQRQRFLAATTEHQVKLTDLVPNRQYYYGVGTATEKILHQAGLFTLGDLLSAHLGVLRALEELGRPIDVVGGTSIGAVAGSLLAAGYEPGMRHRHELLRREQPALALARQWAGLEAEAALRRLAPLQISPATGRLQEWIEDYKEVDPEGSPEDDIAPEFLEYVCYVTHEGPSLTP